MTTLNGAVTTFVRVTRYFELTTAVIAFEGELQIGLVGHSDAVQNRLWHSRAECVEDPMAQCE